MKVYIVMQPYPDPFIHNPIVVCIFTDEQKAKDYCDHEDSGYYVRKFDVME